MQTINPHQSVNKLINVIHHSNGIRESIFKGANNAAVDEWAQHYRAVISQTPHDVMLRELVDMRIGMPSPAHGIQVVRALLRDFPDNTVRMAFLYTRKNAVIVQLFLNMINLLRIDVMKLRVRYFTENERDAAIDWLLTTR